MIDIKCDHGDIEAEINGDVAELSADMLTMIHSVYSRLFEESTLNAMLFRACMEERIQDAFIIRREK